MPIPYSVAIRSVGDNKFLRQTLSSLLRQTVKPDDVVIVIPEDVEPWSIESFSVRFARTERGMVSQRAAGIKLSVNKFVLLLDDDIVLEPDAAETCIKMMSCSGADCIVPYWPGSWPKKNFMRAVLSFWGIAIPRAAGGITYTAGGGYYYPMKGPGAEYWETRGGAGAVIMLNKDFSENHGIYGDYDLQAIGAYALHDDGAFIFDIVRNGGKCLMVPGVSFEHLGGSTRLSVNRLYMQYKASIYNHYIFWKKYIRPEFSASILDRLKSQFSFCWYILGFCSIGIGVSLLLRSMQPVLGIASGLALMITRGFEGDV